MSILTRIKAWFLSPGDNQPWQARKQPPAGRSQKRERHADKSPAPGRSRRNVRRLTESQIKDIHNIESGSYGIFIDETGGGDIKRMAQCISNQANKAFGPGNFGLSMGPGGSVMVYRKKV